VAVFNQMFPQWGPPTVRASLMGDLDLLWRDVVHDKVTEGSD